MASIPLEGLCETPQRPGPFPSEAAAPATTPVPYTDVEQQAWEQFSQGAEVRLPGECPDWRTNTGKPHRDVDPSLYTLSGSFVAQLLTRSPPGRLTDPPPVVIRGARIAGDIVVDGAVTPVPVKISCTTVEGNVRLQDWHALQGLDLFHVRITRSLKFYDVRAQSLVAIAESDIDRLEVLRSRFSRDLSFRGTRVRAQLKIASTRIDGSLLMGCRVAQPTGCCCASYGQTIFLGVNITNGLDLIGSRFFDNVSFEEIRVDASIQASHTRSHKGLTVLNSNVGGGFYMSHSAVQGPLVLSATTVGAGVPLRHSTLPQVAIHRSDIDRYIDFRASTLRLLSLEGTSVHGELRMGTGDAPVDWGSPGDDARFIVRNTRVDSLQDTDDSWPRWLRRELDGFEYDKLSGVTDGGLSAYLRGADWFKEWLAGDETYSPQPYRHLSEILLREGQREVANELAYTAKERERTSLPRLHAARLWLGFLRYSIGYGIGLKPLRILWWMLALVLLGWFLAFRATRGSGVGPWPLFWYSIAYTVPGLAEVKNDDLTALLSLPIRRWFAFQRLLCVAFASLAGAAAVGLVNP